MLHHPCILGDPQHRGTKSEVAALPLLSRGPKRGQRCYVTSAFSGSPTKGGGNKSGPQKGGSATSPLRSRGSPNKGTKSKVAHKWAEVLHNSYVLGGPRKGFKSGPRRAPRKNPIVGSIGAVLNKKNIGPKGPPCLTRLVEKSPSERRTRSEVANKASESSKTYFFCVWSF